MAKKKALKKPTGLKVVANSKAGCPAGHPDLEIGGGVIVGARCGNPRPGYDIYIGLDQHSFRLTSDGYPWDGVESKIQFCYPIVDMSVPTDATEFHKLIVWMAERLAEGKRIHIGCIGGHGRTGLVLAALVAQVTGNKDATTWVRKHHCDHAVETTGQIDFLHKHFGIKKVKSSKQAFSGSFGSQQPSIIGQHFTSGKQSGDGWEWENYPPIKDSESSVW